MAKYSGAQWRPISVNFTYGNIWPRLVIVHIMAGTLAGTDSWFRNPAANASAHFGTGKSGLLYQWIDTVNMAWHIANGNSVAIGIENEGQSGEKLTAPQFELNAQIFAWAHKTHGIPLRLATSTADSGLAWHGLGGAYWGGHPNCPGTPIVNQLSAILARARAIIDPPPSPSPPSPIPPEDEGPMQLKNGYQAETIQVFKTSTYTSVMLASDNSRTGAPAPKLRIATHDNSSGQWVVKTITLPNSDKTYFNFPASVNILSIVRVGDNEGDVIEVAYRLY